MRHPISSHLLVVFQLAGVILCCYPVGLVNHGSYYALLICAIGTATGIYTLLYNPIGNFSIYPEPKAKAKLITDGPYRHIRHPMYFSLWVMMVGVTLFNYHWSNLLGLILVSITVSLKALREEQLLINRFPAYRNYIASTARVIPGIF